MKQIFKYLCAALCYHKKLRLYKFHTVNLKKKYPLQISRGINDKSQNLFIEIKKDGITAWGEQNCKGETPDVFADVSKALGFIDWASRCVDGMNVDHFGLVGYERWAKRQYCKYQDQIKDIKTLVNSLFSI